MNTTVTSVGVANSRSEQDVRVQEVQREIQQIRIESVGLSARIKNSTKLSEGEKNALLGNVATVSKFAQGSLKTKLLSNISATTLFIERFSGVRVRQAEAAPVQEVPAKPSNVEKTVQQSLERLAKSATQKDVGLQDIQQTISKRDVEKVLNSRPEPTPGVGNVEDTVVISAAGAQAADVDLPLPGSGDGVSVPEVAPLPVIGSGEYSELAAVELLGQGEPIPQAEVPQQVVNVDIRLPGEAGVAQIEAEDLQFTPPTTVKFA